MAAVAREDDASTERSADRKRELGQFMTSAETAAELASWLELDPSKDVQLLEPSAGTGALVSAVAARLRDWPSRVTADVVEIDRVFLEPLMAAVDELGPNADSRVIIADFLERSLDYVDQPAGVDQELRGSYTHILMNPPYARLASSSEHSVALSQVGLQSTNLYSAFMSLALKSLRPGGQLVAIVPRSFCNGRYFRRLRKQIRFEGDVRKVRVIGSRTDSFKHDGVIQENVIIDVRKQAQGEAVDLSFSETVGAREITFRRVPAAEFFHSDDQDAPWILAKTNLNLREKRGSLAEYGLVASTGSIVDFRNKARITESTADYLVPLIHAHHVLPQELNWPDTSGGMNSYTPESTRDKHVLPAGNYVVVRRFSSKEQQRRIIAAVFKSHSVSPESGVAFENHVNVIHQDGHGLPLELADRICSMISSEDVDTQFRAISGSTQVNCSDLGLLVF
jgi:adenine-specific DNA-methyltransferase